jgi:serine/threonine protein kinase
MPRFTRKREDIVGTPEYLSPEILLGQDHSFSVDWWALGIILFEFLVGLPPFTGDTPEQVFERILAAPIPWSMLDEQEEQVSDEARELIKGLLARDPKKRLGTKGTYQVKSSKFFKTTKWETVTQEPPQFVPTLDDPADTSYFDPQKERHPSLIMAGRHDPMVADKGGHGMDDDDDDDEMGSGRRMRHIGMTGMAAGTETEREADGGPDDMKFLAFDYTHPRFSESLRASSSTGEQPNSSKSKSFDCIE